MLLEPSIDPDEAPVAWTPIVGEEGVSSQDNIMDFYKDRKFCWYCEQYKISGGGGDILKRAREYIDRFYLMMDAKSFGRVLIGGMDIGRKRNSSEISIFEQIDLGTHNVHIERFSLELDNVKFREQKSILKYVLKNLPIKHFRIDCTGVGADISEEFEDEFPQVVEGVIFNPENKAEMAKNFRFRLEDKAIAIYADNDSIRQIHSIKKTVTEASHVKYGTEKHVKEHHGDKFWAKALASSAGDPYDRSRVLRTVFRSSGDRIFSQGSSITKVPKEPTMVPLVNAKFGAKPLPGGRVTSEDSMWGMFADHVFRKVDY
jgi:hypothetical protein